MRQHWAIRLDEELEPYHVRCAYCWERNRALLREDTGGHLFCGSECEDLWRADNELVDTDWPLRAWKKRN